MSDLPPPPAPAGASDGASGSDGGSAAPPPGPAAADSADGAGRRRLAIGAAAVAVVAVAAVAAITFLGDGEEHPDEWDPRVTDLVAFVEDERGLDFEHPVHIDFLTADEYSDVTRASEDDLSDEDRASIEDTAAVLRSLGLVSGEVDLFASINDLTDSGTLAFYDHGSDRITVRGTETTPEVEATLVHELVHALQDQHTDLGRLASLETSGEAAAFRAVVEGDASLVEDAYLATLDADVRDEIRAEQAEQVDQGGIDEVPGVLTALFVAPYVLGEPLVGIVHADGGWAAVDEMLDDPPTTELELLEPTAYLEGFAPVEVDAVELPDGHESIDDGDFGAIGLYLVLATRIEPVEAFDAAEAWAGDAYLTSAGEDGRRCTEIVVAARGGAGADRLATAVGDWVDATPAESDAVTARDGDEVSLRACDPGPDVDTEPAHDPLDAIVVPATRAYFVHQLTTDGLTATAGACVADRILGEVPLDVLTDPEPSDDDVASVIELVGDAVPKCRAA